LVDWLKSQVSTLRRIHKFDDYLGLSPLLTKTWLHTLGVSRCLVWGSSR